MDLEETGSYFSTVILCFSVPNCFCLWPLTLPCCTVAWLKIVWINTYAKFNTIDHKKKHGKFLKRWNTRTPYVPPEKSVGRSRKNSYF